MERDLRLALELRRRDLMKLVQRMERSGPFVIAIEAKATLSDELGRAVDAWPLANFTEAVELDLDGFTGCDVRYRLDGAQLIARFVFRSHVAPADADHTRLSAVVRALPQRRRVPRALAGCTLVNATGDLTLVSERMSDEAHQDEQARARQQFSKIDAEIGAQISALPSVTAQEERDRQLLTSARQLLARLMRDADAELDHSLASLTLCQQLLVSLDRAEHYAQMVMVACAVHVADVVMGLRPECRVQLEFNEANALREIDLIDSSDESFLRMLRLLTLCMKCADGSAENDLRRTVEAWLANHAS